jgi:hypothetical protein
MSGIPQYKSNLMVPKTLQLNSSATVGGVLQVLIQYMCHGGSLKDCGWVVM